MKRRRASGGGSGGEWGAGDGVAERFEAADEATFHGGAVALVKGGGTEVAVRDILGEHVVVVNDDEEDVGAAVVRGEVRASCTGSGVRGLHERGAQPVVALAGATAQHGSRPWPPANPPVRAGRRSSC